MHLVKIIFSFSNLFIFAETPIQTAIRRAKNAAARKAARQAERAAQTQAQSSDTQDNLLRVKIKFEPKHLDYILPDD